jgi:hypothetical protein
MMITATATRLSALEHAEALLEQERYRLLTGEREMLFNLINPGCADPDCSCCDHLVADAGEQERWLDARYRSAFNKLLFEVAEVEKAQ